MRLSSAALFLPDGAGYQRVASYGAWPQELRTLPEDDVVIRFLRHEEKPMRLGEARRRAPAGDRRDVAVAVPLTVRHELVGVAFYGSHADGLAIDPEELELLGTLAGVAAVTFGTIDARQTREELIALRRQLEPQA